MIENGQGQFMKDRGEETFQRILTWFSENSGTMTECGKACGVSLSTVKRHVGRVRKELENKK